MIKRIVKLHFKQNQAQVFLNDILPLQKRFTRNFPGCHHLELWVSKDDPDLIFSYSYWETVDALNQYRMSKKFEEFWKKTKALFSSRAEAYSIEVIEVVSK